MNTPQLSAHTSAIAATGSQPQFKQQVYSSRVKQELQSSSCIQFWKLYSVLNPLSGTLVTHSQIILPAQRSPSGTPDVDVHQHVIYVTYHRNANVIVLC